MASMDHLSICSSCLQVEFLVQLKSYVHTLLRSGGTIFLVLMDLKQNVDVLCFPVSGLDIKL